MADIGYCKQCGRSVELLPDASCPNGHSSTEIVYGWTSARPPRSGFSRGPIALAVLIAGWVLFGAAAVYVLTSSRSIIPRPASDLKIGQTASTTRWDYTPLEITRTASIKDAMGDETSAGPKFEFMLVRLKVLNVSKTAEHIGWDFDEQPVLLSRGETYYFEEYDGYHDVQPGEKEVAWLVFRVPAKRKDLKLKIARNTWDLRM